jgi:SNF2 family DNA or RNA helicase
MDNVVDNEIYYTERKDIFPANELLQQGMTNDEIIRIIKNPDNHLTLEELDKKNTQPSDKTTFRKIPFTFILSNENAQAYFKRCSWGSGYDHVKNQKLIPKQFLNYYYINYVHRTELGIVHTFFIIVLCINAKGVPTEFITLYNKNDPESYSKEDRPFMQFLRCQQKFHFEEMNNLKNKSADENVRISMRISECNANYMSQKMIEQPPFLEYNLFYYQKADVNFMLQQERDSSTKKFIMDGKAVVNWGTKLQCIFDREKEKDVSYFIERRTVQNYKGELNSFRGGCLCNSPGLGKTVEMLTLCTLQPSRNLILVPDHLFDHWIHEFKKHVKEGYVDFIPYAGEKIDTSKPLTKSVIYLITYNKLSSNKRLLEVEFTRFIIDEFHELFDKKDKTFPLISDVKSQYKWAITATPFVNSSMIFNIFNFVAEHKIKDISITKYLHFLNVFCQMFRKNTKESVEGELSLPKINEMTYILSLSEMEQTMLNSICSSAVEKEESIKRQMAFCINPNLYFQDGNGISEKFTHVNICEAKVINMHKVDYENLFYRIIEEKIRYLGIKEKSSLINNDIVTIYNFVVNKKDDLEQRISILDKHFNSDDKVARLKKRLDFETMESVDKGEFSRHWTNFLCERTEKTSFFGNTFHPSGNNENVSHIKKLEADMEKIRSTMVYFEQQIKLINRKTKELKSREGGEDAVDYVELPDSTDCTEEEITCSICLGEIDSDFTLLQCGHAYCTICLKAMLAQTSDKCPQCQFSLRNTVFYTPKIKEIVNKDFAELIKKYGTKIAHLINICKKTLAGDKTIVYCDSPSLIDNLVMILNDNGIDSITPDPRISIIKTVKEFQLNKQVLVLSSEFNASGLNIQFAKNIILLQPIRGEYARVRQTENQIIGRLHRIGQTKEINLIRLIIKNSIETEIIRQNKIIDTDYSSCGKKTDYPETKKQVLELDE